MRHFWNWVKNDDETRTLYLEGVIAEESWFSDDITPAMFKEELFSGNGPITLHINSPAATASLPVRSTPCSWIIPATSPCRSTAWRLLLLPSSPWQAPGCA